MPLLSPSLNMENKNWQAANRNYLMACIVQTYEELALNLANGNTEDNGYAALRSTAKSVDEAEEALTAMEAISHLEILTNSCGLSPFEQKILLVCAGVQMHVAFGKLIANWHGNENSIHPSFGLMLKGLPDSYWQAISPEAPLQKWQLVRQENQDIVVHSNLKIDESVLHFLLGVHHLSKDLEGMVSAVKTPLYLSDSQAAQILKLATLVKADTDMSYLPVICLKGTNQLPAAMAICRQFSLELFKLNMNILSSSHEDLVKITNIWNRDAAIKGYGLYIDMLGFETTDSRNSVTDVVEAITGLVLTTGITTQNLQTDYKLI